MAEQLANLQHREGIQTFEFNVTNLSVNGGWGALYYTNATFDTGINLTNKKYFVSFYDGASNGAFVYPRNISDNTKLEVCFMRPTSAQITGKLFVMVTD